MCGHSSLRTGTGTLYWSVLQLVDGHKKEGCALAPASFHSSIQTTHSTAGHHRIILLVFFMSSSSSSSSNNPRSRHWWHFFVDLGGGPLLHVLLVLHCRLLIAVVVPPGPGHCSCPSTVASALAVPTSNNYNGTRISHFLHPQVATPSAVVGATLPLPPPQPTTQQIPVGPLPSVPGRDLIVCVWCVCLMYALSEMD
jgi:hypothetical protein